MPIRDAGGHALSGANARSLEHYERSLHQLRCYFGDPVAAVDSALSESPDFTMAHVLKAWLHLLGTEPEGLPVAAACHAAASRLPLNDRERGHLTAVKHLVD